MRKKQILIDIMNALEFGIADLRYEKEIELVGKEESSSGKVEWYPISKMSPAFARLFQGEIKRALKT